MSIGHWNKNYDLLKRVNWVMFDVLNYMCVILAD